MGSSASTRHPKRVLLSENLTPAPFSPAVADDDTEPPCSSRLHNDSTQVSGKQPHTQKPKLGGGNCALSYSLAEEAGEELALGPPGESAAHAYACALVRRRSREGVGPGLRAGRGLTGRGREAEVAAARARANEERREGRGGAGWAVGTTYGDDGRGGGRRRAGGDGGRRGSGRRGGGRGPGSLSAEGRGPDQQVLGEPGDGVPAGFGAGLAGQALQEGGFARS